LDSPFADQIGNLTQTAETTADSNQGIAPRVWRIPAMWMSGPLDIMGFTMPFDRKDINEAYQGFFSDEDGRAADSMAAKLQGDYLSSQERAFRFQHATSIRCTMHAANRRTGHGMSSAGLFARISEHIQDVILSRNAGG